MAAGSSTFSSAVGSHEDAPPLVRPPHPHEWELLSMSTVSSSTLLSSTHGLGFGLPPLSTHLLPHTSIETESPHREVAEPGYGFGGSDDIALPLDVSQIAAMSSSTSRVEPFTEGWKPQFRIAGATLQENYYAPDPFAPSAASTTRGSLEPFPNMEHSFIKEPSIPAGKGPKSEGKQGSFTSTDISKGGKRWKPVESLHVVGDDDRMLAASVQGKEGTQTSSQVSDATRKSKVLDVQSNCSGPKRHGKHTGRSYLAWSVALTTTLVGVLLISYCLQTDHNKLPSGDEVILEASKSEGAGNGRVWGK